MGANVFKYGYVPWRNIRNWPDNVKMFFKHFKWAYQRATKGFCDMDIWNLDSSILDYLAGTIEQLADIASGYPGDTRFPTPESWDEFLRSMANDFYRANEHNDYYDHPAQDAWEKEIEGAQDILEYNTPSSKAMLDEAKDLTEIRNKDLEVGLMKLGEVFHDLWD